MALKKYAEFTGRSTRSEYWYFVLFNIIISIVLGIVEGIITAGNGGDTNFLSGLYAVAVLIPSIAVAARRLHDIGKSGWWMLIGIIPIIGTIILIVWLATDSKPGSNQYGSNPKNISVPQA